MIARTRQLLSRFRHDLFEAGVFVKAIDGALELLGGALLLFYRT